MKSLLRAAARPWVLAFAAFFTLATAWALATPLTAAADEPSHMIRAAAVARGELYGTQSKSDGNVTTFRLPARIGALNTMPLCFAFRPEVSAGCQKPLADIPSGSGTVSVPSRAGTYNPLYYWFVGLPTLVAPNEVGAYLMRIVSAALCSALMASALVTALERRRPTWAALGVAVSATPMVLFLNGVVNPNSAEDASAVLVWSALLALATDPDPTLTGRRLRRAAIGCVFLANARELGPLWIVAALAVSWFLAERGVVRDLLRDRRVWWTGGVAAASCVAGLGWYESAKGTVPVAPVEPNGTFGQGARFAFDNTGIYLQEMIGRLGWLDTPIPFGSLFGWVMGLGVLALAALAVARLREAVAVVAVAAAVMVVPIMATAAQYKSFGNGWQGRYTLALGVGLPILAGVVASRFDWRVGPAFERRLAWAVGAMLGVAGAGAFWASEVRYAFGAGAGRAPLLLVHAHWSPPGSWLFSWLLFIAGTACLYAIVIRSAPRNGPQPIEPDAAEPSPSEVTQELRAVTGRDRAKLA